VSQVGVIEFLRFEDGEVVFAGNDPDGGGGENLLSADRLVRLSDHATNCVCWRAGHADYVYPGSFVFDDRFQNLPGKIGGAEVDEVRGFGHGVNFTRGEKHLAR